jgi:predicted Zn-dependent protease
MRARPTPNAPSRKARVFRQRAHGRTRNAEGSRLARRRAARADRQAHGRVLHVGSDARRHSADGAVGHRPGAGDHRRSPRRSAGSLRNSARSQAICSSSATKSPTGCPPSAIDAAKRAEAAALAFDPRITNSEGGSFDSNIGGRVFANSRGFAGSYRSTIVRFPRCRWPRRTAAMERDYWFTIARDFSGLEDPELVGRTAAERVMRRLGAVKVETQRCRSIFEPRVARTLLGNLFEAVEGRSIYRQASFLAGKLGEKIADRQNHAHRRRHHPGPVRHAAFRRRRRAHAPHPVIEKGVLKSYLLNTYTARKLGMKTTGQRLARHHRQRGHRARQLLSRSGRRAPEEIIRGVKNGFYVTELIGSGVNTVTGDYSRGAVGCGFAMANWRSPCRR